MTEPRTEAGRRLLAVLTETRRWPLSMVDGTPRDAILAIEAEAAAGPRTDPDLEDWDTGTYRGPEAAEAAAGPRDGAVELCPECGGQYSDLPGHRRLAHNVPAKASE